MAVRLLLLCLTGLVLSEEQPDVDCLVVNLDYVHCVWNGSASPAVNYTFYSTFGKGFNECARYVLENNTTVGCDHPYSELIVERSNTFTTKLMLLNSSFRQIHHLKNKVKLNAPINLTVKNGSDSNLWYYWNDSHISRCIVSQVRHRKGKEWENKSLNISTRTYSINLPSSRCRYELQVRSTIASFCGESSLWSDWSPSAFWGSNRESNGTGLPGSSMSVWSPMLLALGSIVFIILSVTILVRHERLRAILPDPGKNLTKILADGDVEDWLPISKSIKEGFSANYSERACSVREYSRILQSASESSAEQSSSDQSSSDQSSGSFASSVTTDQTNCSVSPSVDEPAGPTSCDCDASTIIVSSA
ncbi:cytokine receptor common subunit gamma-like [Gadus chalcogrammus]|uniref:cytokine receptor common subunit gamma-like n=1 Tax=Gadus chalcogrammus TaxID=1042646 RepID=UPI0024C2DDA7|nr:cytokine receptor common subunit gamma-like [Gadus chalcogrammus]